MSKTVRFIGEQRIGDELIRNIKRAGMTIVDTPDAEITVTYCVSLGELEEAYFGSGGIIQTALPGSYLLDLSAATPTFARELNAVATISEFHAVEAPLVVKEVSRPEALSDKDNLMCFIAGDESDIAAVSDVVEALVGSHIFMGEAGSAQLARCVATLQSAASLAALIEADALCRATDSVQNVNCPGLVIETMKACGTITPQVRALLELIDGKQFQGSYTVYMLIAELNAALMAADDVELILPGAETIIQLLELLFVIGGEDMSPAALSLIYGEEAESTEQGLDWTKAEQTYEQETYGEEDFEDSQEDEYPPGFSAYSSN